MLSASNISECNFHTFSSFPFFAISNDLLRLLVIIEQKTPPFHPHLIAKFQHLDSKLIFFFWGLQHSFAGKACLTDGVMSLSTTCCDKADKHYGSDLEKTGSFQASVCDNHGTSSLHVTQRK